jgi:hypothetical protein
VVEHTPTPLLKSVPGFPPALWAIIERTLNKDPAERYSSAAELSEALTEFLRASPGSSTVEHDLGTLVEEIFGSNAFDVQRRVQETAPFLNEEATAAVATMVVPRPPRDSEQLATQLLWPGAAGSDPFASDVIDALRQQQTPESMDPTAVSELHTELRPQSVAFGPRRRSTPLMVLTIVLPFLLIVVVVVAARSRPPKEITPHQIPVVTTPGARVIERPLNSPSSVIGAIPARSTQETATKKTTREHAPKRNDKASSRKDNRRDGVEDPPGPRRRETVTRRRPPAPMQKARTQQTPAESPAPTAKEVMALIRKVNAIDPARAGSMRVTLAESGGQPDKLRQLRAEAQTLLRSQK